jgi:hypothetical protein
VQRILYAVLGLLAGAVLVALGTATAGGPVRCGGEVMSRGDSCVSLGRDSGTRNYDEQQARTLREGFVELGLGALLVLGGAGFLGKRVRDRRRAAVMVPPGAW